jgi:CysZ protein
MQPVPPPVPAPAPVNPSAASEFFSGIGYLGRGAGMWLTSPKLMFLGAIPALIVGAVYVVGIVFLILNIDRIAAWATPFAETWSEPLQTVTRIAATLALIVVAVLVVAYTYAAVTLLVGDPFYEKIWRAVETRLGNPPADPDIPFLTSVGRAIGDAIRLLLPAILVGITVFACGLIPIVGSPLALTLGAIFGGWLLTVEMTGFAFDARGFTLSQRRRTLRRLRARTMGFGIATYLLFLVPIAAVVVMPSAVAGAAMLSRDALARADAPARAVVRPK